MKKLFPAIFILVLISPLVLAATDFAASKQCWASAYRDPIGNPCDKAFDNLETPGSETWWNADIPSGTYNNITVDLNDTHAYNISSIRFFFRPPTSPINASTPQDVELYASNDNSIWALITSISGNTNSEVIIPLSGIQARYWRGNFANAPVNIVDLTSFNVNGTIALSLPNDCGVIASNFTLTRNQTEFNGTCFAIGANGITIDGNGFTVYNTQNSGVAIDLQNYNETVVKNFVFKELDTAINASTSNNDGLFNVQITGNTFLPSLAMALEFGTQSLYADRNLDVAYNDFQAGGVKISATSGSAHDNSFEGSEVFLTNGVKNFAYYFNSNLQQPLSIGLDPAIAELDQSEPSNNNVYNNSLFLLQFYNTSGNTFSDIDFLQTAPIKFNGNAFDNNLIDTPFEQGLVDWGSQCYSCKIIKQWSTEAKVQDPSGNPIDGAVVYINNTQFSTGSNGFILSIQTLSEFEGNNTINSTVTWKFNATKTGFNFTALLTTVVENSTVILVIEQIAPSPDNAFYVLTQPHALLPNGVLTINLTSQLIVNKFVSDAFKVLSSIAPSGYSLLVNPVSNLVEITGNLVLGGVLQGPNWSIDQAGTLSLPQRSGTVLCTAATGRTTVAFSTAMPDSIYSVLLTVHEDDNFNLVPKILNKTTASFSFILRRGNGAVLNCANRNTNVDWLAVDN